MTLVTRFLFTAMFICGALEATAQSNGILREVYAGISGTAVSDLMNSPIFPDSPTSENVITDFFEAPTDIDENYGQRLRALLVPPLTGSYTFWIASDDNSVLYLSTDATPANKAQIASVPGWTGSRQWSNYPEQTSAPVPLVAGNRYYIEALMKEGGGGDNLAVRWQLPNATIEEPIPVVAGATPRLLVYGLGPPQITTQPTNITVIEGGTATFSVQVSRGVGMSYQWQRNGAIITGATSSVYSFSPVQLADSGASFRCVLVNSYGTTNSSSALLTVVRDTTPPTVISVANLGDAQTVSVLFSEPLEASSATQAGNYTLNNGASVGAAAFANNSSTIVLTTSPLTTGRTYTLTINNVRDRASIPNTIAPNTQRTFTLDFTPLDASYVIGTTEPIGPSSRRTGLIISEIMYHPTNRVDLKNLEFIELFNTHGWPEEIGGFRLSGAIDYIFPSNTTIAARSYLVVAPSPVDVQNFYGIAGVLGGFSNQLQNSSGTVRLRNRQDAVLLEANYSGDFPYPVAADGLGHSLVLARPSYGEGNPRAWAASDAVNGSPGAAEPQRANPYRTIVINEFLAHTDDPEVDYIELYNYGASAVTIGGCFLSDDPDTNKFTIPLGTTIAPRGFYFVTQTQMNFSLSAAGETIFLKSPDRSRIIDAVRFKGQENGVSTGRYPDGSPDFYRLSSKTRGAGNSRVLPSQVIINELMYNPLSGSGDDEYIEMYNRGTNAVNLSGWKLSDGISFTFPPNAVIPTNAYVVVANNFAHLITNYPGLSSSNTFGNYGGSLGNSGEHVTLTMPDEVVTYTTNNNVVTASTNIIHITVNEVSYGTGGRWGKWNDGGGSSLELTDAHGDTRLAANWADSDETAKAPWTTVEFTGVLDNGNGSADSFQIFLLGEGECLVDNVEVFAQGGGNLIANSDFESGSAGWFFQGNHDTSSLETSQGFGSSKSIHLRATGRGDPGANRIRTALASPLSPGTVATLRAKVRWLKGTAEILLRLRGNWIEAPGSLLLPANPGTPGARNSRVVPNAGPAVFNVNHAPILPAGGQAVTVTASVNDPDGLASLVLKYRIDPSTNLTAISMVYNGAGYFSATIPGQPAGTLVAFSISASDNNPAPASTSFPSDAPNRECLVRFGETVPAGIYGSYKLWITAATNTRWSTREKNSNEPLDGTFVYGNSRVVYNMETLYSGSPWHTPGYNGPMNNLCDYVLIFPADELVLGVQDFVMASVGNLGSDDTAQREQTSFWIGNQLGAPSNYRRYVHMYVNGLERGTIFEDSQQPGSEIVKEWFPDNSNGDLHKIEDWFEFSDSGDSALFNVDATLQNFTTTGGAKKLARYRWNWRKRAVSDSANNYTNLFALVDAMNVSNFDAYTAQVEALVDVDEWVRIFAMEHIVGNWDSYGFNRGKNMYAYKPENDRWSLLAWDIDFTLGLGGSDTDPILPNEISAEPTIIRFLNHPPFARAYLRALQAAVNGPLSAGRANPMMDGKYNSLVANGVGVNSPAAVEGYIANRRSFITQRLATLAASFVVTNNNGNNFSTNRNLVVLGGVAPFAVKTVTVNGIAYEVTWNSLTNWTLRYALATGTNALTIRGLDENGNVVAGATDTISINFTGIGELPQDKIVINEIMYNPIVPRASYLELYNTSVSNAFDLSGYRLDGLDFIFSQGTVLEPGAYGLVVKDLQVFASTYGNSTAVMGDFSGTFDNSGETVTLLKPGLGGAPDVVIDEVTFGDSAPWPTAADGFGPSLQLIDPAQDNDRVANWNAVGSATNAAPQWQYVTVTGTATTSSLYVYLLAAGDVYLDDIKLVAGTVPEVGPNLLRNGDFETAFPGPWNVTGNVAGSGTSTTIKHSGASSLHLVTVAGGSTRGNSLWQDMVPALTTNATYTLSYWYLPNTNGGNLVMRFSGNGLVSNHSIAPGTTTLALYTPGAQNSVRSSVAPFPALRINEIQPNNINGPVDRFGERDPWLEIYNGGASSVNLGGLYLSDSYTNLTKWAFPSNSVINAGQFLIVWADAQPGQSNTTEFHTNFRLSSTNGSITLVQVITNSPRVLDYINFATISPGRSYGSYPDGRAGFRQTFHYVTPGQTNNPASLPIPIVINEWMAANTRTISDPADYPTIAYDDWFELFNPSATMVDLGGYYLTDNLTNTVNAMWKIPNGTTLGPRSYLLVWADNQTSQNGLSADLHANFQLSKNGEAIGLFAPDGSQIDAVTFGLQTNDISQGRYTDGNASIYYMPNPTPRAANFIAGLATNNPPFMNFIGNKDLTEGQTLVFGIVAGDADAPPQTLTFSLDPGAPTGATINASSGVLQWTPGSQDVGATVSITARVTDNGAPVLTASRAFSVTVHPRPAVTATMRPGGILRLSWATVTGKRYRVDYKDDLNQIDWNVLGTEFVASGTSTFIDDPNTTAPQRFYRIVQID